MDCTSTTLSYQQTGYFSKIITDYLSESATLRPFYAHPVSLAGIEAAIKNREAFATNRPALVTMLQQQYAELPAAAAVQANIQKLLQPNTFTIVTAHQPVIFTGPLYFIYKILHTIKLAGELKKSLPQHEFVPVFWMGSEDADLDELGSTWLNGEKLTWQTKQTGAVGRMTTKGLEPLIHRIEGELSVLPYGKELVALLKTAYLQSPDIQTATFRFLHALFAEYGLIVIVPDHAGLKQQMQAVFEDDLFRQLPAGVVSKTIDQLAAQHKVQANPRPINLFYLKDEVRELIEWNNDHFSVRNTALRFTKEQIKDELAAHPERFSPNVILRGLYQETVLPNIAFIGGGGETAYWLELKDLFTHYNVPYPVLVLRNSFLIVEKKWQERIARLGVTVPDLFLKEQELLTRLVRQQSNGQLKLEKELAAAMQLYGQLREKAGKVDASLQSHVEALQARTLKPLKELEKKLVRAEKRKYEEEQRQIQAIRAALFPGDGLQERRESFMAFYAQWGPAFLQTLYQHSLALEQKFMVLEER